MRISDWSSDVCSSDLTLDTALQHIADPEVSSDPPHIDGFALVDGGRIPGDDVEAAKAGEVGNDILGDAVGESGCRGVAADVVERQHGDARLTLCGRAIVFLLIREPDRKSTRLNSSH